MITINKLEAGQPGGDYFGHLVLRARTEAARASAKFPQPNYVTLKIAEESGEVVRAAIHYAEGRMGWPEVEGEIVQLLAMLIRFVVEGDGVIGVTPPVELGRLAREWEETACRLRAAANRDRLNGRKSVYEAAGKRAKAARKESADAKKT